MIWWFLMIVWLAAADIAEAESPCNSPLLQAQQAYECALRNSPEARDFLFRNQEQIARERTASQIPNPEVEAKARQGEGSTFELDLTQELELGGKRDARIRRARSEGEVVRLKDLMVAASISNSIVEELLTLQHVKQRRSLLISARDTLRELVTGLKQRPVLTPEQTTTARIFEIYGQTLRYQELVLLDEESKARANLGALIGRSLESRDSIGISFFKKWPVLALKADDESFVVKLAHLEAELAESERVEARAETYPNLRIGPSFEHDTESGDFSAGAKIGITIPFWHRNQGQLAQAEANLSRMRAREEAIRKEQEVVFKNLTDRYSTLTKFLETSPSEAELRRSLKETQELFVKGLIAPASLVESYRSSFELLEQIQAAQRVAFTLWASATALTGSLPLELP